MQNKQGPLFIFPIGGRGDFLISILCGNILTHDWNNTTVDLPAIQGSFYKLHRLGFSECGCGTNIQADDLNQYLTFKINIDNLQDLLDISYLTWNKRCKTTLKKEPVPVPVCGSTISITQWDHLRMILCLTNIHVEEFINYNFDYVIPFSKLKDIQYICQLYTHINQRELAAEEVERIQYNIDLNEKILERNPFTVTDIVSLLGPYDVFYKASIING